MLSFFFSPSPVFPSTISFDWRLAMTEDNGAFGTQWGVCHCWLQLLPLFFLPLYSSDFLWHCEKQLENPWAIIKCYVTQWLFLNIFQSSRFLCLFLAMVNYFVIFHLLCSRRWLDCFPPWGKQSQIVHNLYYFSYWPSSHQSKSSHILSLLHEVFFHWPCWSLLLIFFLGLHNPLKGYAGRHNWSSLIQNYFYFFNFLS